MHESDPWVLIKSDGSQRSKQTTMFGSHASSLYIVVSSFLKWFWLRQTRSTTNIVRGLSRSKFVSETGEIQRREREADRQRGWLLFWIHDRGRERRRQRRSVITFLSLITYYLQLVEWKAYLNSMWVFANKEDCFVADQKDHRDKYELEQKPELDLSLHAYGHVLSLSQTRYQEALPSLEG